MIYNEIGKVLIKRNIISYSVFSFLMATIFSIPANAFDNIESIWGKMQSCEYKQKHKSSGNAKQEFLSDLNDATRALGNLHVKNTSNNQPYSNLQNNLSHLLAPMTPPVSKDLFHKARVCRSKLAYSLIALNMSSAKLTEDENTWYACIKSIFSEMSEVNTAAQTIKACLTTIKSD